MYSSIKYNLKTEYIKKRFKFVATNVGRNLAKCWLIFGHHLLAHVGQFSGREGCQYL